MTKYTLVVDGMMCGMCESHVNDAVRKAFPVKKVTSSHSRKQTVVVAEEPIDEARLRQVIDATGYTVQSVSCEPYEKKLHRARHHICPHHQASAGRRCHRGALYGVGTAVQVPLLLRH